MSEQRCVAIDLFVFFAGMTRNADNVVVLFHTQLSK